MTKSYVLGAPEIIIGKQVKDFVWGDDDLFFPNDKGDLVAVEGLLLGNHVSFLCGFNYKFYLINLQYLFSSSCSAKKAVIQIKGYTILV